MKAKINNVIFLVISAVLLSGMSVSAVEIEGVDFASTI